MRKFLLGLLFCLPLLAGAQPIIPTTAFTLGFMTNLTQGSAQAYLGVSGGTNSGGTNAILDMNAQTSLSGIAAMNAATAAYTGQQGFSSSGIGAGTYTWVARSTNAGDWMALWQYSDANGPNFGSYGTSTKSIAPTEPTWLLTPSSNMINSAYSNANPLVNIYSFIPYNSSSGGIEAGMLIGTNKVYTNADGLTFQGGTNTGGPQVTTLSSGFSVGGTNGTVTTITGIQIGQFIAGTSLAANTYVTSIAGSVVGFTPAATGSSSGSYTFTSVLNNTYNSTSLYDTSGHPIYVYDAYPMSVTTVGVNYAGKIGNGMATIVMDPKIPFQINQNVSDGFHTTFYCSSTGFSGFPFIQTGLFDPSYAGMQYTMRVDEVANTVGITNTLTVGSNVSVGGTNGFAAIAGQRNCRE